jgi:hypothetical protein
MGVSHCMMHAQGQHALIALFAALYPEGVRVNDTDGWLPIHYLRILREPDEEVTPEDIVTIKLLVAGPSHNIPLLDDDPR